MCPACCSASTAIHSAAPSRPRAAPCRCSTTMRWRLARASSKEPKAKAAIEKAIARLYEMQSSSARFRPLGAVWRGHVADGLRDRLPDPREGEGLRRPRQRTTRSALDRLKNTVNNARDFKKGGEDLAYSLYVLARSGRGVLGDLRYYADTKIDAFSTPIARRSSRRGSPCSATRKGRR